MTQSTALEWFTEALDRRGAALARWPAAERARAEDLLQSDAQARAALAEAARLDALLAAALDVPAPLGLAQRILSHVAEREERSRGLAFGFRLPSLAAFAGLAAAACLALGVFAGAMIPSAEDEVAEGYDDPPLLVLAEAAIDSQETGQ